jgi:hypothetical protein
MCRHRFRCHLPGLTVPPCPAQGGSIRMNFHPTKSVNRVFALTTTLCATGLHNPRRDVESHSVDRVTPRRPSIRSRNFRPCFLYASEPAKRKASQIRAALCPSRCAIASISFFRFDCTLKLRRVSFLIEGILALRHSWVISKKPIDSRR